jgi:IS30 family transposase
MGRNKSTISRELSRNTGKRGYRHKQATRLAVEQQQEKNKPIKLTDNIPFDRLIECCTYDVNLRDFKITTNIFFSK